MASPDRTIVRRRGTMPPMEPAAGIAFVDVETTGLRPGVDRIAEVAVVTLDHDRVERWSRTVDAFHDGHAPTSPRVGAGEWRNAPRFSAIARMLAERLEGRLVVAHNARFDHAFLRAELAAAGIVFAPRIVCSVMLSRRLFPDLGAHDLDSLARAHGLTVTVRHRALPDAELLLAWWRHAVVGQPAAMVEYALRALLAGPLLPAALDPAIVDALPDMPGAYAMHDEQGVVLASGAAANLRLHVTAYFRVGHASGRALAVAHRVRRISWQPAQGILGARLRALAAPCQVRDPGCTWRFDPGSVPCVTLHPCDGAAEAFGTFITERQARGALARLAARAGLCRRLLGLEDGAAACSCCGGSDVPARGRALLRVHHALRPWRIEAWPAGGPIALRERGELHVLDRWRYLGSASGPQEVHACLERRAPPFDPRVYRLVRRALARAKRSDRVDLAPASPRQE